MSDKMVFSHDEIYEHLPPAQVPEQPATDTRPASAGTFHRYHIETRSAPDLVPHSSRFRVNVKKHGLLGLLLKELFAYRGNVRVALSRPCVYGVFSGPLGGMAPREELCVGCLRCTVQHPDVVQIRPHPERQRLGDSSMKPEYVDTIVYEARDGRVPRSFWRGGLGWSLDGHVRDCASLLKNALTKLIRKEQCIPS